MTNNGTRLREESKEKPVRCGENEYSRRYTEEIVMDRILIIKSYTKIIRREERKFNY